MFVGAEQFPEEESQVPATWHWSAAGHVFAAPVVQVPLWQVSVHLLPQSVPFAFAGVEHVPEPGSHVPAVWHSSIGGQSF
jgi:hypothetical protein